METIIVAKSDGTIKSIKVSQDDIVGDKQLLIVMSQKIDLMNKSTLG